MEELKAIPLVQVLLAFCEGTAEPYQWGILAGCCVYAATVLVVFYLLAAGGSFRRMREQAEAYERQGPKAFQVPLTAKPRLYDNLLEAARALPAKPAVKRLTGHGVELVALGEDTEEGVLQTLFEISDGSARYSHGSYDPIEHIWRWLPAEAGPFETADAFKGAWRKLVADSAADDRRQLYIRDVPSGYIIGAVSILNNRPAHLRAEIGDLWITPAFRGGYAVAETALLLLDHLFGTLGYRRIEWCCDADNHAGRKLAARLGFVAEGVLRKHMVWRDANRDSALYALTNADWREGGRDTLEALVMERMKDAGLTVAKPKAAEEEETVVVAAAAAAAAGGAGTGGEAEKDKKDK